jgi:hypothetical protein
MRCNNRWGERCAPGGRASVGHDGRVRRWGRSVVGVVVAGLLVAACSGTDGGAGSTTARGSTTTSSAASAPASTAAPAAGGEGSGAPAGGGSAAPATTTARAGGTRSTSPTTAGTRPTTATTADATEPAPGSATQPPTAADDGSQGPPGAFARTVLRPQPATTIALERQQQSGAAPASASFAFARDTLQRVTNKTVAVPAAITLPGGGDRAWTADELRAVADANGRAAQGGGAAVIRLLFVHGTFEGSDDVLGVTVRGDVVAVFTDAVAGATTPVLSGDTIEEAVLVHELGHVLGLVDLARDTGRADKDHPGHSTNTRSVMYWAVESSLVGQVLTGPPPRDFDAADLADLEALRNGA